MCYDLFVPGLRSGHTFTSIRFVFFRGLTLLLLGFGTVDGGRHLVQGVDIGCFSPFSFLSLGWVSYCDCSLLL